MSRPDDLTVYKRRCAALERLLTCYRLGTLPTEKQYAELERTRQWVQDIDGPYGPSRTVAEKGRSGDE